MIILKCLYTVGGPFLSEFFSVAYRTDYRFKNTKAYKHINGINVKNGI